MSHMFPVRVYYEDTDMAGIVYHANYLRYIERARSDWVLEMGIDQNALRDDGIVFAVRRIEADYLMPARFDDRLDVATDLQSVSPARLILSQTVLRGADVLFRAIVTVTCMSMSGRPARLPATIRRLG